MPIAFAARMPAMRPDSIAAMRAVAMLVAVWLATLIPVRTQAVYCMGAVYITRHAASNSRLECAVRCAPRKEPRVSYIDT